MRPLGPPLFKSLFLRYITSSTRHVKPGRNLPSVLLSFLPSFFPCLIQGINEACVRQKRVNALLGRLQKSTDIQLMRHKKGKKHAHQMTPSFKHCQTQDPLPPTREASINQSTNQWKKWPSSEEYDRAGAEKRGMNCCLIQGPYNKTHSQISDKTNLTRDMQSETD